MSTQVNSENDNNISIVDTLLYILENSLIKVEDKIKIDLRESRKGELVLHNLAISYKKGLIKLTTRQLELLDIIFIGRENQRKKNNCLGEALGEVIKCKNDEEVEKEIKYWT